MMIYIVGFAVSVLSMGMRVLQTKNVTGQHYKLAVVTSWGLSVLYAANVFLLVDHGWWMVIPTGMGSSLGGVLAMYFHDKYIGKKKGHR